MTWNLKFILEILAILFIALDAIDTYVIMNHGGRELNHLGMYQMIHKMGLIPALSASHGFLISALVILRNSIPVTVIGAIAVFYIALFIHNIVGWIKAGHSPWGKS